MAVDNDELDELAARLDDVRARRATLDSEGADTDDAIRFRWFRDSFQQQLAAYQLGSVPPDEVTIDERTLLPVNDGFQLSFDVALGISASDTIRTKWAYHTALLETATAFDRCHHAGLLILDEARQQETDRRSLAAFLQRLKANSERAQVLYATSEDPTVLQQLLRGIPHTRLPAGGTHMIGFRRS